MKFLLLALSLIFTNCVFASLQMESGSCGFQGEFLYLHPSFNDTYFAIEGDIGTGIPSGKRFNNSFDFKPGFRVTGGYSFCCPGNEIYVQWTHLNGKNSRTVSGFLNATDAYPPYSIIFADFTGNAESDIRFNFNSANCFYQKDIYLCCPLALSVRLGLQYARISTNETILYTNTDLDVFEQISFKESMWGIGPEIGLAADLSLSSWKCLSRILCGGNLSFTFLAWGSLLASNLDSQYNLENSFDAPPVNSKDDQLWRIVPAMSAKVGLKYANCFNCFCNQSIWSIEVGYEFTTYRDAISKTRFDGLFLAGASFNYYSSFDMQGPYLAAALSF